MTSTRRIGFSDEQAQLLDIAGTFCRQKSPIDTVRSLIASDQDHDPAVWSEIVDLGWLGIAVPEELGGIGLGLAEVVTVMEPMGRHLLATPFASTTLTAQALLTGGSEDQQARWLTALCTGTIGTLALYEPHGDWTLTNLETRLDRGANGFTLHGIKRQVLHAASADLILVSASLNGSPCLVALDGSAIPAGTMRRETVIDETRRSYEITFDGLAVDESAILPLDRAASCLAHIDQAGALLVSAESCGGAAGVMDYTLDYLNTRTQFGHRIGSYQALKHTMADVLIGYETARSHLYHAAYVFHQGAAGMVATRMAKAQGNDAFAFAADRAIQFHGGFGFTYDCDAQLYRRRAMWNQVQHGDSAYHRKLLADALL